MLVIPMVVLFSSNVAIHYGEHVFSAICNHCGGNRGLGYKDEELLNLNMIKKSLQIYILTGMRDNYLQSCAKAKKIFENVACSVTMEIMNNRGHRYYVDKETDIWNFVSLHQIKDDQ
ncbi:unnamed protein product [Rotaria sp. Silwood1]|nr:unnamed protein product [Rotaria sp. Silwood1]